MDFLLTCPIKVVQQIIPQLLRDVVRRNDVIDILFERMTTTDNHPVSPEENNQSCSSMNSTEVSIILRIIAKHYRQLPFSIIENLLELLELPGMTLSIIHEMGQLVYACPESRTPVIFEAYLRQLHQDRTLFVPIIGSLSEMSLTAALEEKMILMIMDSLGVIHEDDLPTAVSSLLQFGLKHHKYTRQVVNAIRAECALVKPAIFMLILDILSNAFRLNLKSCREFLRAMKSTITPTRMYLVDLFIVLMAIDRPAMEKEAGDAFLQVLKNQTLTLEHLRELAKRMHETQEWTCYVPAFLKICHGLSFLWHQQKNSSSLKLDWARTFLSWFEDLVGLSLIYFPEYRYQVRLFLMYRHDLNES